MRDYSDRKNRRTETLFKEEIARILTERKDPEIGFVTVTRVIIGKDRGKLFCYVKFLSDKEKGLAALVNVKNSIKSAIASSVPLRFMPDIEFLLDEESYYSTIS